MSVLQKKVPIKHLEKMVRLDSYFVHRYIIIEYRSSLISDKSTWYNESYGPFCMEIAEFVNVISLAMCEFHIFLQYLALVYSIKLLCFLVMSNIDLR